MNSSKEGRQRLTTDGHLKSDPVILRGGEEIVYTVQETPTRTSLMRWKAADGTSERLHPAATTSEFEAAFSPDGRLCVFVQSRGNLNLKLVIRDTRTGKDALFDPGGGFSGPRHPTVSPDGSRLVFSLHAPNGQVLVSVNPEGQDRRILTQEGLNSWPAYSPDGKWIAFGSSRAGDYDLYLMAADGTGVRALTRGPGMDLRPAWSPDSRSLVFTSNRDGNYEIYRIGVDGTGLTRLTHHPDRDDYPAYHPDGRRVLMVSERQGKSDLYLVDG